MRRAVLILAGLALLALGILLLVLLLASALLEALGVFILMVIILSVADHYGSKWFPRKPVEGCC